MNIPNYENMIPQGNLNKALYVLTQIFGVKTPMYVANAWFDIKGKMPDIYQMPENQTQFLPNYENVQFLPADESKIKSSLGTPVFGDIRFEGSTYNKYNKYTGIIEQAKYGGYTLPYSCLVDFSRDNNVITTPVLGGAGTVKEIYGIGDWNITIRGIAFILSLINIFKLNYLKTC